MFIYAIECLLIYFKPLFQSWLRLCEDIRESLCGTALKILSLLFELLLDGLGGRVVLEMRFDIGSSAETAPAEPEDQAVQLSEHASIIILIITRQIISCPEHHWLPHKMGACIIESYQIVLDG
jgi:hypothetical protein